MSVSARLCIPAILSGTPLWERRAILDGLQSGRFRAIVRSGSTPGVPEKCITNAAIMLKGDTGSRIESPATYRLYCLETIEDPFEGSFWRYDAYRRRVGH